MANGKILQGEWSNAVMIVLKDLFFAFMGMSPYRTPKPPDGDPYLKVLKP